jgi:hypothetical protein
MVRQFIYLLLVCSVVFSSCKKDEQQPGIYTNGILIVNEGNYNFGTGDISCYDRDKQTVSDNIFKNANDYNLGDVAQSVTLWDNKAFIVVNNSAKVEVVNAKDFKKIGTINIPGSSPRYLLPVSASKAYLTELYANKIWILDLQTLEVTGSINVNGWTEDILLLNGEVFVTQRTKLNGNEVKNVLVIDRLTDAITATIPLPSEPVGMTGDGQYLWVSCGGKQSASVLPSLHKINVATKAIENSFTTAGYNNVPSRLCLYVGNNSLYYIDKHVYKMEVSAASLPVSPLINGDGKNFYTMSIINNEVYVSDAIDYLQKSKIYRYTTDGALIDDFTAGIISGQIVLNN